MKKFKKVISMMLVLAMSASLLAGCGGSDSDTADADTTESTDTADTTDAADTSDSEEHEEVTLSVWAPTGSNELWMSTIVEPFQEMYPWITLEIEIQDFTEYPTLLKTALNSGDGPDVSWINTENATSFIEAEAAIDLTEYYDELGWADIMGEENVEAAKVGTESLCLLLLEVAVTPIFYYSKPIFEELNLEIPTTDAEFAEVVAAIEDAGYIGCVMGTAESYLQRNILYLFVENELSAEERADFDLETFDWTSDAAVAGMERFMYYCENIYDEGSNALSIADTESLIATGQVGIVHKDSYWLAPDRVSANYDDPESQVGLFYTPVAEEGTEELYQTSTSATYFINKESENVDAGILFLDYLISKEGQEYALESGMGALRSDLDRKSVV